MNKYHNEFNEDCTSLSHSNGQSPTNIFNCDPFGLLYSIDHATSKSKMLFSTSLLAAIDGSSSGSDSNANDNRVLILNGKKNSIICELNLSSAIIDFKINRKRLVVLLFDKILIYDVSSIKLLFTIELSNSLNITPFDLSSTDNSILLFERGVGDLVVFDCIAFKEINHFECHKAKLRCIKLSHDALQIATCSTKGTIIRVFNVANGQLLDQFRRGSYKSDICSLAFDKGKKILTCANMKGSIHLFKLSDNAYQKNITNTEMSILENNDIINTDLPILLKKSKREKELGKLHNVKKLLPERINSLLEPQRSFAQIKLEREGECRVALVDNFIYVAQADYFYTYSNKYQLTRKASLTI